MGFDQFAGERIRQPLGRRQEATDVMEPRTLLRLSRHIHLRGRGTLWLGRLGRPRDIALVHREVQTLLVEDSVRDVGLGSSQRQEALDRLDPHARQGLRDHRRIFIRESISILGEDYNFLRELFNAMRLLILVVDVIRF